MKIIQCKMCMGTKMLPYIPAEYEYMFIGREMEEPRPCLLCEGKGEFDVEPIEKELGYEVES